MIPMESCQPIESAVFSASNIARCERYVRSIQRKLDRAVAQDDNAKRRWCTLREPIGESVNSPRAVRVFHARGRC